MVWLCVEDRDRGGSVGGEKTSWPSLGLTVASSGPQRPSSPGMRFRVHKFATAHVGGIGAAKLLVAMTGEQLLATTASDQEENTPLGPSITRLTRTERPNRRGSAYTRAPEVERWETYERSYTH
jgi:hypothetical protein